MFSQATRSIASTAARRAAARSIVLKNQDGRRLFTALSVSGDAHHLASGVFFAAAAIAIANNQQDTTVSCTKLPVYGVPGTNQERTFLAVKPDGVQRALVGDIIARFEKRGYKLVGLKMVWPTLEMAQNHYKDLAKKPFYPGMYSRNSMLCWMSFISSLRYSHQIFHVHLLCTQKGLCKFFSSGPIICMCWEGKDVIAQGRQMLGETQPLASKPGSIRGDYSIDLGRNICHGSDSPDSAAHELKMWFPEGVNDWKKTVDSWVYEN
jgi:nucleoside-diphosphate kinase